MSAATHHYAPYHPKWYRHPVSVWWWLERASYTVFVVRELTSVAVGYFAFLTLWQVRALLKGPEAYGLFLERMKSPFLLVVNAVALLFVVFHSVTWFNLAPKAMQVRLSGRRVPDTVVAASNYFAWVAISLMIFWLLSKRAP